MAVDPWAAFNPQPAPAAAPPQLSQGQGGADPWAAFNPQPASGDHALTIHGRTSALPDAGTVPDPALAAHDPGATGAAVLGAVKGIPIAGPIIMGGLDRAAAGLHTLVDGTDYGDNLRRAQAVGQAAEQEHPYATAAGSLAGAIASSIPMVAAAPVAFGAKGATMLGRIGMGALTNGAMGATDAGIRTGGDIGSMAAGGALGAAGGVVGGTLGRVAGPAAGAPMPNPIAAAADRLGITVPKAVASNSRIAQAAGSGIRNIPFAGEPLMQASENTLRQLGETADKIAGSVGTSGAANAGRGAQAAAQRAADQAATEQAAYEAAMGRQASDATAGAQPLAVGGAVQDSVGQLGERVAAREAAPAQQFATDLGGLGERLGPADRVAAGQDITGGLTRYAQETLPAQQEAAYEAALSGIPRGARTPLEATRDAASEILAARVEGSLQDATGGAVRLVSDAIRNRAGLTVAGLQTLRRSVGELLRQPTLETSMSRGELSRIYAALSDDLGNAVATHGGPEAATAFDAANALTRDGRRAVSAVNRVAQQSPERAFGSVVGMAGTGTGGDAARLASIRGMVGDEGFAGVPAAALARAARDRAGNVSPAAFARNIGAMTAEGRAAMFGAHAAEVQELAGRAALLARAPADAERPLADRLAQLTRGSAERALGNILALASSGGRTDIQQLADLRNVLGEGLWSRVGGALIRRAGFDDTTGAFRPDGLVKLAENMTPQARAILYGESASRRALDAARGMSGQPFNAARLEAEVLKRSLGQSDEGAFARLAAMASSGSRADIAQLARLRSTMAPQEWADMGATVIGNLGRDAEGAFSPDRYITAWGKLSGEGKALLFPDKGLRTSLDDIATVSSRFKELRKYANPSGTARNTAFHVGALAAVWAEPITTITSMAGANVLARILSSPATAKSMAQWSRAYELAVTKPGQGTRAGFEAASRGFGATVAGKLGVHVPLESFASDRVGAPDDQHRQKRAGDRK